MRAQNPNPIRQYPYPHEPKEKRGTREKKIHSIMVFSKDNLIGFLLALSSSAFIGASFIIKKKGLRKAAAASGVRAGDFFYLIIISFGFLSEILIFVSGFWIFSNGYIFDFHFDQVLVGIRILWSLCGGWA